MSHSITVDGVSDDLLRRLDQRAEERGVDRSRTIREILEKALEEGKNEARKEETTCHATVFDEILAPAHAYSREKGYTDEEIDVFVDRVIDEYRSEHRKTDPPNHNPVG